MKSYKKKAANIGEEAKDKIVDRNQKLQESIKERMVEAVKGKAEFVSRIISKIFWKILILIGVAAFAYGFGSSFPK